MEDNSKFNHLLKIIFFDVKQDVSIIFNTIIDIKVNYFNDAFCL